MTMASISAGYFLDKLSFYNVLVSKTFRTQNKAAQIRYIASMEYKRLL